MNTDPLDLVLLSGSFAIHSVGVKEITGIIVVILLLFVSAMMSGSEVAFFSLNLNQIDKLKQKKGSASHSTLKLLENPKLVLATILIANNFVNVGIVVISTFVNNSIFDFSASPVLGFIIQVIVVTLIILFFGEILPKLYSSHYNLQFAQFIAIPMVFIEKVFYPFSILLINSTSLIDKRFAGKKMNISINDISHALELTDSKELKEDEKILKGIVKFGNIDVKEIMKSRIDVIAVDIISNFNKLLATVVESGYSRIPVFSGSLDNIKGILYTKDLLPHLHKGDIFRWQSLIRPPYYVPEAKKINDLLEEFQVRKIHMAVVIDEFGGFSGIVTLEDILEEIVGEISDEFDDDDELFVRIDEHNYIFEAKILLNDFCKILDLDEGFFGKDRGEADTLAGLILEIKGEIPRKNENLFYKNFEFRIKSADNRRIKQVFVKIIDL